MINPPLNKTLGVITFSTCGKQPNLHRLFRVNSSEKGTDLFLGNKFLPFVLKFSQQDQWVTC
ncbi:hypothetical protein C4J95_4382 [Pseudomonas orientalis]|nr:hypothetical protein C4J95_4382 [Pseudomonas orientalis]